MYRHLYTESWARVHGAGTLTPGESNKFKNGSQEKWYSFKREGISWFGDKFWGNGQCWTPFEEPLQVCNSGVWFSFQCKST